MSGERTSWAFMSSELSARVPRAPEPGGRHPPWTRLAGDGRLTAHHGALVGALTDLGRRAGELANGGDVVGAVVWTQQQAGVGSRP